MSLRVAVVTVTYGDRFRYLEQVLRRLRGESCVVAVVVVDNGSQSSVASKVQSLGYQSFVQVITHRDNLGSAAGYARGLRRVYASLDVSHVYLLDDDNLPETGAVDELAHRAADLPESSALASVRREGEHARLLARGLSIRMHRDSFLGFSLLATLRSRLSHAPSRAASESCLVPAEYAPYGGFFFRVSQLDVVGFPREDFVLYADDHEFTHRFVRSGGRIWLCTRSSLCDLEPNWHGRTGPLVPFLFDPRVPDFRVFYSVRNRVAFEREHLLHSRVAYATNATVWLSRAAGIALCRGVSREAVTRRLGLVLRAARAGWRQDLGCESSMPLPN